MAFVEVCPGDCVLLDSITMGSNSLSRLGIMPLASYFKWGRHSQCLGPLQVHPAGPLDSLMEGHIVICLTAVFLTN